MTSKQMSEEQPQRTDGAVWMDENLDDESRPVPLAAMRVKTLEEDGSAAEEEQAVDDGITESMHASDRLGSLIGAIENSQIAPAKAVVLRAILKNIRGSIDSAIELLDVRQGAEAHAMPVTAGPHPDAALTAGATVADAQREVEGVFNGEAMVGDDGKEYTVPPNYASKSKLVEGDLLKLYINSRGNFIYKQIGPIERQRIIGALSFDQETGHYMVIAGGRSWKVLKASVTYFKAEVADEAVILVPKNAPSRWAAVENVIKRAPKAHEPDHQVRY